MAWLDATPEKQKRPRRASLVLRQKKGEDVPELEPVEVEPALQYLIGYLFEAGPTEGDKGLTCQELRAWCDLTGVCLDGFEVVALRQMSRAYLGMAHKAQQPECPNPAAEAIDLDDMEPEQLAAQRAAVSDKLNALFGALEEKQGKGGMTKRK